MKRFSVLVALAFLLVPVACGGSHPLAGAWHEHLDGGKEGRSFEFDSGSDALMIHTAPRPDGGHDHLHGTYELTGETLTMRWSQEGKEVAMKGKVSAERIELEGGGAKLVLEHSEHGSHGH